MDAPASDWQAARQHLSVLAREAVVLARGVPDNDVPTRARVLALLISARHGYAGDTRDYDNLRNANLIHVIERRRGLPVALGIIWLHAARAVGWAAHGVDFPGHFLLALEGDSGKTLLDVFAGGAPLDTAALLLLLKAVEGQQAESAARPAGADVLARGAAAAAGQHPAPPAGQRRHGRGAGLHRRHAAHRAGPRDAVARGGAAQPAARPGGAALRCYGCFLRLVPQGDAAERTRATMNALRSRLA